MSETLSLTRPPRSLYPTDSRLSGWYHCLPEVEPLPLLQGELFADVVIVGAGFAGLAAARQLHSLEPRMKIVVLEAQRLAWAASGRNSGFVIDLPHELSSENHAGAQQADRDQIQDNRMAIDFIAKTAADFGLDEHVSRIGKYHGATNGSGLKALSEFTTHLEQLDEPYTRLSAADMNRVTGSQYYDGGLYTPGAALIQPAGYIRGLGQALAARDSIDVFERSPVLSIRTVSGGARVHTERGRVHAQHVILANNGHIESFGIARGRLLHLYTYASMSEPLSPKQSAQLGEEESWGLIPASPMGTSIRKLSNGRVLVRNQWTYNPNIASSERQLERYSRQHDRCFARRYPAFTGLKMQYRWSGPISMTLNSVPVFGEVVRNVFAAAGCQGLGTTKSTLMGMLVADKVIGLKSPALARLEALPKPAWMPHRWLNRLTVPAYLKWVQWRAGRDL